MGITIIDYQPKYQPDFARLNYAWIEKFFKIEAADRAALDYPDEKIISKGGRILLAYDTAQQTVVGTCALVNMQDGVGYELAKMSVAQTHQGLGIGKNLGISAVELAKELGAKRIYIETNSSLKTALNLYEQLGFQYMPKQESPYERSDTQLELWLN
jgi:GNAT superfamily N-acetyltransferase